MASRSPITFDLTPESQARFSRVLRAIALIAGKSLEKLIFHTAGYYLQSARKASPLAKQKRKVRHIGKEEIAEQVAVFEKRMPWGVLCYSNKRVGFDGGQSWAWKWYHDRSKAERRQKIGARGAARASWIGLLRELGKPASESSYEGTKAFRAHVLTKRGYGGNKPAMTLSNQLGYIGKAVPGIAQQSLIKAQNRLAATYLKKEQAEIVTDALRKVG